MIFHRAATLHYNIINYYFALCTQRYATALYSVPAEHGNHENIIITFTSRYAYHVP